MLERRQGQLSPQIPKILHTGLIQKESRPNQAHSEPDATEKAPFQLPNFLVLAQETSGSFSLIPHIYIIQKKSPESYNYPISNGRE